MKSGARKTSRYRAGQWNRASFETLAAAQQLASELNTTASAGILGLGIGDLAGELAARKLEKAYAIEHELLRDYTPDAFTIAIRQFIERAKPSLVLFPHTYQVRDFLPKLAASMGRVAVSDVVSHRMEGGKPVMVRQLFQGKVNAAVSFRGEAPWFASLQAGSYRADRVEPGSAPVETYTPTLSASDSR